MGELYVISINTYFCRHSLSQLSSRLQPDLPKASYLTFDKFDFIRETLQGNTAKETLPRRKANELVSMLWHAHTQLQNYVLAHMHS